MELSKQQMIRYKQHLSLDKLGIAGQTKLLESKVLIIGAGGLGSPAALYLAAAGVGTIGLVDGDKVDLSNLQRQIIHTTSDIGQSKTNSAKSRILAINPEIKVRTYPDFANADNIRNMVANYDFVIDATDNFDSKFLINDACYFEKKAFSHAGVLAFSGQLMTVIPGKSACYRCVFNSPPAEGSVPTSAEAGVLSTLPAVIGSLQATEAIKFLLGIGELLTDKLLSFNALSMEFRTIPIKRNPNCLLCGSNPKILSLKGGK